MSYVNIAQQQQLFAGIKLDLLKMQAIMPNGMRLDRPGFNILFGGHAYSMDAAGERVTMKPWEAFTMNEAYRPPMVNFCA